VQQLVPANNGTKTPFVPKDEDAYQRCVNGLLLEATARGTASFFGLPPTDPAWGDLGALVKDTVKSPMVQVAAVYAGSKLARRFVTKQVASRFAAKIGSTFIPGVGEAAGVIVLGQSIWDGFSWYKSQIEGGACEAY
jgi:hypothetical protein